MHWRTFIFSKDSLQRIAENINMNFILKNIMLLFFLQKNNNLRDFVELRTTTNSNNFDIKL